MRSKVYVAWFLLLGFSSAIFSADWATSSGSCYKQGDKNLEIGLSLPFYPVGIHAAFDYAFHDAISGGGGIGFLNYWNEYSYLDLVIRGAFHPFNLKVLEDKIKVRDKLDVYVGIAGNCNIGLGVPTIPWAREYVGARWYFTPTVSVFLEDCSGFGYFDGGICFKF